VITRVLERLEKVRGRNGTWTACCPAHVDSSPSLAIREVDDGRILMHCFAGCPVDSILSALDLNWTDLFSESERQKEYPGHFKPPVKPAFFASDLLRILALEALIITICASDMRAGKVLSDSSRDRLLIAQQRIEEVMHYAHI